MYETTTLEGLETDLRTAMSSIGFADDETAHFTVAADSGDTICSLKYDGAKLKLVFHQKELDGEFTLDPEPSGALPPVDQTPDLREIAPRVGRVADELRSAFDVASIDFAKVDAASIAGGGHPTDFEFEYEVVASL